MPLSGAQKNDYNAINQFQISSFQFLVVENALFQENQTIN
jgi:hypothetical protein